MLLNNQTKIRGNFSHFTLSRCLKPEDGTSIDLKEKLSILSIGVTWSSLWFWYHFAYYGGRQNLLFCIWMLQSPIIDILKCYWHFTGSRFWPELKPNKQVELAFKFGNLKLLSGNFSWNPSNLWLGKISIKLSRLGNGKQQTK